MPRLNKLDVAMIVDLRLCCAKSGAEDGLSIDEVQLSENIHRHLKEREIPYCVGSYPFSGAGRARCMGATEGFVKILAHQTTDRVLGVHIIGARAADMIAECGLALEFGAAAEDIARTVHGHPTFAEALQEAAMGIAECAIYGS